MAKVFDTWTVLPHQPIQKLGDNVWSVDGTMPDAKITRVMTLAKLRDGRVVVHNAIALNDDEMKQVEAWGTPSFIVVPNGFHRQDAYIFKKRYPNAKVLAPEGARKKVEDVVKVDGNYDDLPHDDHVRLYHIEGIKKREGVLQVRSGDSSVLVFNDAIMNQPKMSGPMGFFLGPTGRPSIPRVMRWLAISDKRVVRDHLHRMSETPGLSRLIVSHGKPITDDPSALLKRLASEL